MFFVYVDSISKMWEHKLSPHAYPLDIPKNTPHKKGKVAPKLLIIYLSLFLRVEWSYHTTD